MLHAALSKLLFTFVPLDAEIVQTANYIDALHAAGDAAAEQYRLLASVFPGGSSRSKSAMVLGELVSAFTHAYSSCCASGFH